MDSHATFEALDALVTGTFYLVTNCTCLVRLAALDGSGIETGMRALARDCVVHVALGTRAPTRLVSLAAKFDHRNSQALPEVRGCCF